MKWTHRLAILLNRTKELQIFAALCTLFSASSIDKMFTMTIDNQLLLRLTYLARTARDVTC